MRSKPLPKIVTAAISAHQQGASALDICEEYDISEQTFFRWQKRYGRNLLENVVKIQELERLLEHANKQLRESKKDTEVLGQLLRNHAGSGNQIREIAFECFANEIASARRLSRLLKVSRKRAH